MKMKPNKKLIYDKSLSPQEKRRLVNKNSRMRNLKKYKDIVYNHYGRQCINCGQTNPLFLTLDHIHNDGYMKRKRHPNIGGGGYTYYLWLINHHFPKDIQVLCYNCNCGKERLNGVLPFLHNKMEFTNGGGI